MAIVTAQFASFNNGLVVLSYTFADTDGLLRTVTLTNDGPTGVLSISLTSKTDGSVIFEDSIPSGTQTKTTNVVGQGVHLVPVVKNGTTFWSFPFGVATSWAPS